MCVNAVMSAAVCSVNTRTSTAQRLLLAGWHRSVCRPRPLRPSPPLPASPSPILLVTVNLVVLIFNSSDKVNSMCSDISWCWCKAWLDLDITLLLDDCDLPTNWSYFDLILGVCFFALFWLFFFFLWYCLLSCYYSEIICSGRTVDSRHHVSYGDWRIREKNYQNCPVLCFVRQL